MSLIYKESNPIFFRRFDELKADNWTRHKKYIRDSVNPNFMAMAIRTDNVFSLQQILLSPYYRDTNVCYEKIPISVYERFPLANGTTTLLEYAAYFGSVKCFKYLILQLLLDIKTKSSDESHITHPTLFEPDDNEEAYLYHKSTFDNLDKYDVAS